MARAAPTATAAAAAATTAFVSSSFSGAAILFFCVVSLLPEDVSDGVVMSIVGVAVVGKFVLVAVVRVVHCHGDQRFAEEGWKW